jgi:hypothetical protein
MLLVIAALAIPSQKTIATQAPQTITAVNGAFTGLLDQLAPTGECSNCTIWEQDCMAAATDAYHACRAAGGGMTFCNNDYRFIFNGCMAGTGCGYTPIRGPVE